MILLLICMSFRFAEGDIHRFVVRQVTADTVYLEVAGPVLPEQGEQLTIRKGEQVTATLEVIGRSSRFISCKILSMTEPVQVGDQAEYRLPEQLKPATAAVPVLPPEPPKRQPQPASTQARSRKPKLLRGTVALQFHQYQAKGSGSGFTQPTFRLNLRSDDLADGLVGFQFRTRSRYYQSERENVPTDWDNRIYKASVRIGREEARFQTEFGRLISNKISGVGYLDGATARMRLGTSSQVGLFAGVQPDWQKPEGQANVDKYGAFFNFTRGKQDHYWDSTIALAGEYTEGEVNREFVYLHNRYTNGAFSLYQSAELDINRGWRSERASQSLALTNLFIQGAYRASDRITYNLGYDNRQSYYTWDLRNQDEAYFESQTRRGFRASIAAKLFRNLHLNAGGGQNTLTGEDDTRNWYLNLYDPELFKGGWSLKGRVNGFRNPYTEGVNPALQLGKRWRAGHQVWLGYSTYQYDYLQSGEQRKNNYIQLEASLNLGKSWFLSGQYEQNSGDDAEGQHLYIDLGLRL